MSPYDQSVYDAGFKYIPQSKFLLNPFQIPQGGGGGGATDPTQPGLPSINIGGGGGGGFNPYNPDMSQIRTDYSPFAARQYFARPGSEVGIPSGMLADSKFMYGNQIKLPGILGMGQEFLKKIMPINERAIVENEARGAGIFTDDIGRVVAGPGSINTGANIMAGYNLNKITPQTLEKRRAMIEKNMKDPIQKKAKLDALDEFEEMYFGPYGIKTISTGIYKQRKDKKDAAAAAKQKAKDDAAFEAAFKKSAPPNNDPNQDHDNDGIPNNVEAAGGSYDGGYHGAEGGFESTGSGGGAQLSSGMTTGQHSAFRMADGGRIYFMDGGIVDLVDIYD